MFPSAYRLCAFERRIFGLKGHLICLKERMPGLFDAVIRQRSARVYTAKLAHAKLPTCAGNTTCILQVKRPHTQFTCVTCSLPVKTGKYTCFYAASTSRRIQAICMQPHVNLPEHNGYFTGNFTCGTHANLSATSIQNHLILQAKIHASCWQKHLNHK